MAEKVRADGKVQPVFTPHDNSIENILEEMNQIEASVSDPVRKVSDILNDIADSYQNLIETNGYDSVGNAGN